MSVYVDERDAGIVILTHTYLLVGCALPLWLALLHEGDGESTSGARSWRSSGRSENEQEAERVARLILFYVPALAGVAALGVADAAASVVGSLAGGLRWLSGSKKTVAGTCGGVVATLLFYGAVALALAWSHGLFVHGYSEAAGERGGQQGGGGGLREAWSLSAEGGAVVVATVATMLLEAFTEQIDNLFLPLFFYAALLATL